MRNVGTTVGLQIQPDNIHRAYRANLLREQIDFRPDQIGDLERFFAWQDPYLYRPVRGDLGVDLINNRLRRLNGRGVQSSLLALVEKTVHNLTESIFYHDIIGGEWLCCLSSNLEVSRL